MTGDHWPFFAGVVVDRSTARGVLTLMEKGRTALRVDGRTQLPVEIEKVFVSLRVLAGQASEPVEVPTKWIGTDVAARRIGVTRQHVGRMARDGLLRSQRVGRALLVAEVDVLAEVELRTSVNLHEPGPEADVLDVSHHSSTVEGTP